MKRKMCTILVSIMIFVLPAILCGQINTRDTKFLSQPAISKNQIAFVYAGDLWTANIDGNNIRRLTSDDGRESNPVFSANGKLIAFSAQYDGNMGCICGSFAGRYSKTSYIASGLRYCTGFRSGWFCSICFTPFCFY